MRIEDIEKIGIVFVYSCAGVLMLAVTCAILIRSLS
jgi:hypothetical protein